MHLTRLVYYSENRLDATGEPMLGALQDILRASKRNNAKSDITGALTFDDFWFFQALEGPREAVWSVFLKLMEDARHGNVVLVELVPVDRRAFGAWSMRLVRPSPATTTRWSRFVVDGLLRPALMSSGDILEALVETTGASDTSQRSVSVESNGCDRLPRAAAIAP